MKKSWLGTTERCFHPRRAFVVAVRKKPVLECRLPLDVVIRPAHPQRVNTLADMARYRIYLGQDENTVHQQTRTITGRSRGFKTDQSGVCQKSLSGVA